MPKSEKEGSGANWGSRPFQPLRPNTGETDRDALLRAANALEYIAAQLGQINAKLSHLLRQEGNGERA